MSSCGFQGNFAAAFLKQAVRISAININIHCIFVLYHHGVVFAAFCFFCSVTLRFFTE